MGQALYRKYRSKSLKEIIGQEHITETLAHALKTNRISHAYLFTGPRGVGKTSIARILAHEINQLPYDDSQSHLDIIEIDAASNRRIDEIRDLRDKVHIAPAQAKYKVYIIDEVHMLTKEAFNALLKTLEEPPAHVVFILATTEAHKLPETIISRTQRFVFRPIEVSKIVQQLRTIADKEHLTISDEALALIAEHSGGSLRDATSLLDQAGNSHTSVELTGIQTMLGIPAQTAIAGLIESIERGELAALVSQLNQLYEAGFQAAGIAKQLATTLRDQLIADTPSETTDTIMALLAKLLEVPTSHNPDRYLEIILMQAAKQVILGDEMPKQSRTSMSKAEAPASKTSENHKPQSRPDGLATSTKAAPKVDSAKEVAAQGTTHESTKQISKKVASTSPRAKLDEETWTQILVILKQKHNTLYGIVRMAQPDFSDSNTLQLAFAFAFHQKRASEAKNQQAISDAVKAVSGQTIEIVCIHDPELKLSAQRPVVSVQPDELSEAKSEKPEPLEAISNIFGGGELLQS